VAIDVAPNRKRVRHSALRALSSYCSTILLSVSRRTCAICSRSQTPVHCPGISFSARICGRPAQSTCDDVSIVKPAHPSNSGRGSHPPCAHWQNRIVASADAIELQDPPPSCSAYRCPRLFFIARTLRMTVPGVAFEESAMPTVSGISHSKVRTLVANASVGGTNQELVGPVTRRCRCGFCGHRKPGACRTCVCSAVFLRCACSQRGYASYSDRGFRMNDHTGARRPIN
jgi:hypothetical protein